MRVHAFRARKNSKGRVRAQYLGDFDSPERAVEYHYLDIFTTMDPNRTEILNDFYNAPPKIRGLFSEADD